MAELWPFLIPTLVRAPTSRQAHRPLLSEGHGLLPGPGPLPPVCPPQTRQHGQCSPHPSRPGWGPSGPGGTVRAQAPGTEARPPWQQKRAEGRVGRPRAGSAGLAERRRHPRPLLVPWTREVPDPSRDRSRPWPAGEWPLGKPTLLSLGTLSPGPACVCAHPALSRCPRNPSASASQSLVGIVRPHGEAVLPVPGDGDSGG